MRTSRESRRLESLSGCKPGRWLCTLLAFLVLSGISHADTTTTMRLENPRWYLHGRPAPSSATIAQLTETILPKFDNFYSSFFENQVDGFWDVDSVGIWDGQLVIDLAFRYAGPNRYDSSLTGTYTLAKGIAVQTGVDLYRLVYFAAFGFDDASIEPSGIMELSGEQILFTDTQMHGTGGYRHQGYWVWDEREGVPRALGFPRAHELDFLPKGIAVRKGGDLDSDLLTYKFVTWRDGDSYSLAAGGMCYIWYGLENEQIYVQRAKFDYADLHGKALARVRESADSMDLKKPPIEIEYNTIPGYVPSGGWYYFAQPRKPWISFMGPACHADSIAHSAFDTHVTKFFPDLSGSALLVDAVDTAGTVEEMSVVDVKYTVDCTNCRYSKGWCVAVCAESRDCRLIYSYIDDDRWLGLVQSVDLYEHGDALLIWITLNEDGAAWIWSPEYKCPVQLHVDWVLYETMVKYGRDSLVEGASWLPSHPRTEFDPEKLVWTVATRKGGSRSDPADGFLKLHYEIKDLQLQPVKVEYFADSVLRW